MFSSSNEADAVANREDENKRIIQSDKLEPDRVTPFVALVSCVTQCFGFRTRYFARYLFSVRAKTSEYSPTIHLSMMANVLPNVFLFFSTKE